MHYDSSVPCGYIQVRNLHNYGYSHGLSLQQTQLFVINFHWTYGDMSSVSPLPWDWLIDWAEFSMSHELASGYKRCPCHGYGVGDLWLLLSKPNTGVAQCYQIHSYTRCHFKSTAMRKHTGEKLAQLQVLFEGSHPTNIGHNENLIVTLLMVTCA